MYHTIPSAKGLQIKLTLARSAEVLVAKGVRVSREVTDFLRAFEGALPCEISVDTFAECLSNAVADDNFIDDFPIGGQPAPTKPERSLASVAMLLAYARPQKRHLLALDLRPALTGLAVFDDAELAWVFVVLAKRAAAASGLDVPALKAYYRRAHAVSLQMVELVVASLTDPLERNDETCCSVRPQLGQIVHNGAVFCRFTRGSVLHSIGLWTPLGNLNVWSGSPLKAETFDSIIARFAMSPAAIQFPPPFWDATDSLFRVGVDCDGEVFAEPEQTRPCKVIDSVRALGIWSQVAPDGRSK